MDPQPPPPALLFLRFGPGQLDALHNVLPQYVYHGFCVCNLRCGFVGRGGEVGVGEELTSGFLARGLEEGCIAYLFLWRVGGQFGYLKVGKGV